MKRLEYVESVLNPMQINAIDNAIKRKQPILIRGECGSANGKTTLAQYLRGYGADVHEPDEMLVITLDKPLDNMVQNVLETIED